MAAADFSEKKPEISPGNSLTPPHLCPPYILQYFPYKFRALKILAFLPSIVAFYTIPVRRANVLPSASFS